MRRTPSVNRRQEGLQSDIISLKKQLALTLDENQLLKVKIRKLEYELRRKDKYIESVKADPQKFGKFVHDQSGASLINKLRRRNQELEDIILERDLQEEKRCRDLKTMCLYSPTINCQVNRKGTKSPLQSSARSNFRPQSNSSSHKLLTRDSNSSKFDSKEKGDSDVSNSTHDCRNTQWGFEDESEMSSALKSLELEEIVGERLLRTKDAQISRLSAELKDIKDLLKKQERESAKKSIITTQMYKSSHSLDRDGNLVRTNFVEKNKTHVGHPRANSNDRKSSRTTNEFSKNETKTHNNKLGILHERNEEISLSNKSRETSSDLRNDQHSNDMDSTRPKTQIEYVYDSEVSSDGEELSLPSNPTSFLQQAVNTVTLGERDDTNLY